MPQCRQSNTTVLLWRQCRFGGMKTECGSVTAASILCGAIAPAKPKRCFATLLSAALNRASLRRKVASAAHSKRCFATLFNAALTRASLRRKVASAANGIITSLLIHYFADS